MIMVKKFDNPLDLAKFLRGELISSGTLTTALSGATIADTAGTLVTDAVAADDVIYISGGGEEVVASIGSEAGLTMDGSLTADSGAAYRVCRGKIATSTIVDVEYEGNSANWVLIYDGEVAF